VYLMRLSHSVSAFHDDFVVEFQFVVQTGDRHRRAVKQVPMLCVIPA